MAPATLRLPITNAATGNSYTAVFQVGAQSVPLQLLLDTGSSTLAVGGSTYDPAQDANAKTTRLLQVAHYLSGSFVGGVVKTTLSLRAPDAAALTLPDVNLTVTYDKRKDTFDNADGIFGLSYKKLDNAYLMPADTWQNPYNANQTRLGKVCDLDPCFDQLADAGLMSNKFAFSIRRALRSADTTATALNSGLFIMGGGAECIDLYRGALSTATVVDDRYFNVNLLGIQVGDQSAISAPPVAPGSTATSNAFVDSGTPTLTLYEDLYDKVIASFGDIRPVFAAALKQGADGGNIDQTQLNLADWPAVTLRLQGNDGDAVVRIAPQDYWQFDAAGQGHAVAVICGDYGAMGGQSILGLPLFSSHYVVFDRSQSSGHGTISFATQA